MSKIYERLTRAKRTGTVLGAGGLAAVVLAGGLLAGPAASAQSASATSAAAAAVSAQAQSRPHNGKVLSRRISGGRGVFKVKNGTKKDGVVTLTKGRHKAFSLYVRAHATATFRSVRDGTYRVYFTTGSRYRSSKHRFTRSAEYYRFDDRLRYRTTSTSATIWTITLHAVRGGNAHAHHISPKDFPA
jgi:hypothetical protein